MTVNELNKYKICNPTSAADITTLPYANTLLEFNNILYVTSYGHRMSDEEKESLSNHFSDEELNFKFLVHIRPLVLLTRKNDIYTSYTQFSLQQLESLIWKNRANEPYFTSLDKDSLHENTVNMNEIELRDYISLPLNSNILKQATQYVFNYLTEIGNNAELDFSLNFMKVRYKQKAGKHELLLKYL